MAVAGEAGEEGDEEGGGEGEEDEGGAVAVGDDDLCSLMASNALHIHIRKICFLDSWGQ